MRCFVACFLERPSAERLASLVPPINGVRSMPAENLHVTLQFLGNVAASRSAELLAHVRRLKGVATKARIREVTGFPLATHTRAVVARLSADPRLLDWRAELELRWPSGQPDRPFDAHVTLGRMGRRGVAVRELPELIGFEMNLQAPAAYVSETRSGGSLYRPVQV